MQHALSDSFQVGLDMPKPKLLIARHGNTFNKGDVIRRVGRGTDVPLSASGIEQAKRLGHYLKSHHPHINNVYCSHLQRTQQTAHYALESANMNIPITQDEIFDEIDYGEDEGRPETEVVARIGEETLKRWDEAAIPPPGWQVDPQQIQTQWQTFAKMLTQNEPKTILVITSNGVARFAGAILPDPDNFMRHEKIKLSTGAISCFHFENHAWHCDYWNLKPE